MHQRNLSAAAAAPTGPVSQEDAGSLFSAPGSWVKTRKSCFFRFSVQVSVAAYPHLEADMSGFSPELIDYLEGKISFEEFERRREERKTREKKVSPGCPCLVALKS